MIFSYRNKMSETVASGRIAKGFPPDLLRRTLIKLTMLEYATRLDDLRSPPGNRLEKLSGTRNAQHSIRINDQWRICFEWTAAGAEYVEITDYH